MSAGQTRARSPVRTAARKSIVGSPRRNATAPPAQGATYADIMARIKSNIASAHAPPRPVDYPSASEKLPKKSDRIIIAPQGQTLEDSR